MRRRYCAWLAIASAVLLGACSSTSTSAPTTSTKATVPVTVAPSTTTTESGTALYTAFQALNTKLGGSAWTGSASDAATRAALDCNGAAKSMMGGMALSAFPTDLALIRTYCPSKESMYG